MQRRSGMIHWHDKPIAQFLGLSVDPGDAFAREILGHRETSQGHNDLRVDRRNLSLQIHRTGVNFVRQGISITGRSTLDDVGDKDIFTFESGLFEQLGQKLARVSNERAPFLIFMPARPFADEHDPRGRRSLTRDRMCAGSRKFTQWTTRDFFRDNLQLRYDILFHHIRPLVDFLKRFFQA